MKDGITVDGVDYVRADRDVECERLRIAIVDNRGLTFVGLMPLADSGEWVLIRRARCIIRWGTTKHLAEIASGPTSNTRLGATADVLIRRENIVAVYDAGDGWQNA